METTKRYDPRFKKADVVQKFSSLPKIYYSRQMKGSRFHSRRQPLDPIPVHGTVSHWDEMGFGFIVPDVNLERLDGFAGRVFIHKNDLKFKMEGLEKDDRVTFLLYRDDKGVGAHSCCLLEDEDKKEETDIKPVVTMLIPNKLLSRFIGRKGETIDAISEGCGVTITIKNDKFRETKNELQLVVITGETDNLVRACQEVSSTLTASAASNSKMVFIIPENQTGRFIGNRGIGIKQIVDAELDVKVSISKMTVEYEGSEFNKIVLFGPQLKMKNSLAAVVPKLTKLHSTIVTDYLWGRKRTVRRNNESFGSRDDQRYPNKNQKQRGFEKRGKNENSSAGGGKFKRYSNKE
jgi:cold shock CspA family protein